MRSSSSKVAGWFVPARGPCPRKLSSPSHSTRTTCTPACAAASDRHSPTGPAPTTITRLEVLLSILESWSAQRCAPPHGGRRPSLPQDCASRAISTLRGHDVLFGAAPAGVGEGGHDAHRIPVTCLLLGEAR